jgi:CO/xanthine dehydrogenase Mo-binding subunit/aerobic-type carbon monoxide dehydrogenase small subunit (CoxS/CutS family)
MNQPVEAGLRTLVGADLAGMALSVNGAPQILHCAPSKRLVYALREDLGLTGTKVGCDAGDCGACTVLLDGKQVCACITAAGQAEGRNVTTVEGLAEDGKLNTLQQAFLKHGAAQCGICTPGMLMAATDLLSRNVAPTEAEVLDALGGVLCRCTGYRKIVEAVLAVASNDVALDDAPVGAAVGSRLARLDGPAKLTGAEKYGADVVPTGALTLRIIRSPHARATFTLGDLDAFQADYPQVEGIITAADVPENSFAVFPTPKDQPVLADGHVRFRGEAVLGLLGDEDAIRAIPESAVPITWAIETALDTSAAALAAKKNALHDFAPDNVLCRGRVVKGDVAKALKKAAFTAEGAFETKHVEHAYIEPEAGYAEVFEQDGKQRIRVFVCTQTPYMDKEEVARVLKLSPDAVHIVPSAIGGGFGGKLDVSIQPLLAVAAWKMKRPVRIVYTRPESMVSTTKRHPAEMQVKLGCDAEGCLTAVDFHGDFNTGAYASWGSTVANRVPVHASGPYKVANVRALTRAVYTNNAIAGAFRGFGVPQACIATEALMDDLAEQCGMDRFEFRLKNAIRAGDQTATGQTLAASVGLEQCLEALRPAWHNTLQAIARKNGSRSASSGHGNKRYGAGVACMWYGIGNTVIANPSTMTIGLRSNGRFMLYNGAQEIGQGTYTIMPQIAADALGVSVTLIDQIHGDTDLTEDAGKSSASRQTFVSGNATRFAAEDLKRQLCEKLGVAPDAKLSIEGTTLIGRDYSSEQRLDLAEAKADARGDVALGRGHFNPPTIPLDADGQGVPYATYGFAAQIAEVEVDMDLGTVKVLHIHAAHDIGRAVNPTQVEGQIHGGVAQGLGLALMEEYISGRTDNLHDYLIPTIGDIPPITTHLIEDPEPIAPYGAKGVGEPALIATAPAIFGAIRQATGVRVAFAPCTPDRLRQLIKGQGA